MIGTWLLPGLRKGVMVLNIDLIPAQELAARFGFSGPNESFRAFCQRLGIRPIRRNPNFYDVVHVRLQLDHAQNISANGGDGEQPATGLVEQRRRRLAKK
ncbi:hypothetical protein [Celeribacter sp. SCSIO 80788]|uniref:hypothetical protein n=1 Tax=Celeribacter sp. SCSIO 80788 TaxID=3117013 RepID=UPI003DA5DBAE